MAWNGSISVSLIVAVGVGNALALVNLWSFIPLFLFAFWIECMTQTWRVSFDTKRVISNIYRAFFFCIHIQLIAHIAYYDTASATGYYSHRIHSMRNNLHSEYSISTKINTKHS